MLYLLSTLFSQLRGQEIPWGRQEGLQNRGHLPLRSLHWEGPSSPYIWGRVTETFLSPLQGMEHPALSWASPPPKAAQKWLRVGRWTVGRRGRAGGGIVVRVELAEVDADIGQQGKRAETRLEGIARFSRSWTWCLTGLHKTWIPRKKQRRRIEVKSVHCKVYVEGQVLGT